MPPKSKNNPPPQPSRKRKRVSPPTTQRQKRIRLNRSSPSNLSAHPIVNYVKAAVHPFSMVGQQVHTPISPAIPSQKLCSKSIAAVVSGVNGFAVIAVHPCVANNRAVLTYSSTATFAGTMGAWRPNTAFDANTDQLLINTPYNDGFLGDQAGLNTADNDNQYRIVSFGIRITYNGLLLNRAGMVTANFSPTHSDLSNASLVELQSSPHVIRFNMQDQGNNVLVLSGSPVHRHEMELRPWFANKGYPYRANPSDSSNYYWDKTTGGLNGGPACGLIHIGAPAGTRFDVEYIQFTEFAGVGPALTATPSPSHDEYLGAAHRTIEHNKVVRSQNPHTDIGETLAVSAGKFLGPKLEQMGAEMAAENPIAGAALGAIGSFAKDSGNMSMVARNVEKYAPKVINQAENVFRNVFHF